MMNRCFFLISLFTSFSLLGQLPRQYSPPARPGQTPPSPQQQGEVLQPDQPAPYEPHPYDRHPYEPHPYELHPYEPHVLNVAPNGLGDDDGGAPRLTQPDMFDPDEIARDRRGSAFTNANAQAINWLNLVDQGQYASSWLQAGQLLRDLVTQDQWVGAMKETRGGAGAPPPPIEDGVLVPRRQPIPPPRRLPSATPTLGGVTSRKVTTHQLVQTLPFGSRGNFMIIKYKTNFSRMSNAVETITLAAEGPLQQWKVIAYKIGNR